MELAYVGKKLREIRVAKGMSIKQLAESIDVSSSLLSQIERGLANPSLETLNKLSNALNIPMYSLFIEGRKQDTLVVRKDKRLKVKNTMNNQLDLEILAPDINGHIQMFEVKLKEKQKIANIHASMDSEKIALCTKGQIELHLEEEVLVLKEGDSVRVDKGISHFWKNPLNQESVMIVAVEANMF